MGTIQTDLMKTFHKHSIESFLSDSIMTLESILNDSLQWFLNNSSVILEV